MHAYIYACRCSTVLNDHFASAFTLEDLSSVPSLYIPQVVDPVADIELHHKMFMQSYLHLILKHQDLTVSQSYLLKSVDYS